MVVIEKCSEYEYQTVRTAVEAVFGEYGGISSIVPEGARVVLKPNLIGKKKPEEAATTHPLLVRAVAELCREAGAASVTVCESPGGLYDKSVLKALYRATGIEQAAADSGAELNFDTGVTKVDNPEAIYQKSLEILAPIAAADVVINLAKLKTHGMMVYTGAVKNMFGAIAGVEKAEYHCKMPDYAAFANTLIDIFLSTKVKFSIIDAVTGMHKDGPTAGEPIDMGLLIGSDNAFEADRAALDIIGAPCERVPMAKAAIDRGLMPALAADLDVRGMTLDEARRPEFVVRYNDDRANLYFLKDGVLGNTLRSMLQAKPVFTDKCRACGECARCCPVKAITIEPGKNGKRGRAKADLKLCIRCFCCQELCPFKAVNIKRSMLGKVVSKL